MTPRPDRDDWYRAVVKSNMSNATKLLMVVLVDDMKVYGEVSVPRSQLATKLGVQPRRITERIQEATDCGWLTTLIVGCPGTTSVYQATFPDGADVSTKRRRSRRRSPDFVGADVSTKSEGRTGAPTTTANMVPNSDPSDGADVRPSAERGHGAPVQPPSTTHSPFVSAPPLPVKSGIDEKGNYGHCRECRGHLPLDANGLCSIECAATFATASRAAS